MPLTLSRKILIGSFVMFILYLLGVGSMLSIYVILNPVAVWPGLDFWRLVTYPLALGFLDMIVTGITFSAPGEELEQMIGTKQFGLLLLMVVLGGAILHMVLFFGDPNASLGGMTNVVLFTLIGFVYLFPDSEIRIIIFNVRSRIVLYVVAALAIGLPVVGAIQGKSPWMIFSSGGFGIILGLGYFHARYQKYPVLLSPIRSVERIFSARVKTPSSPRRTAPAARASSSQPVRIRIPFQKAPPREMSDEERLNLILDQIHEKGYASLNEEERSFLKNYSDRL